MTTMAVTTIRRYGLSLAALVILAGARSSPAQTPGAGASALGRVVVRNGSALPRKGEVVQIAIGSLGAGLKPADMARVHVTDAAGKDLMVQPMDLTGDHEDEAIAFQVDVPAKGTAEFKLSLGDKRSLKLDDFKVYGRFVRERFDDFAWENDKVAFRMYGEALETWEKEPLTSSSVDAWVKKTPRLMVDEWYLVDDYHKDHGEGGDFYPAGKTRGCGGTGLLEGGKLYTSKNFRKSRVLSRGPIRLLFELEYEAWDVAGVKVRETKRVTLDAGSNFSRFETIYSTDGGTPLGSTVQYAIGNKKEKGADVRIDAKAGVVRTWEELNRYSKDGFMGCAVVVDPKDLVATSELDGNILLALRRPSPFFAGTGWDRSGDFKGMADFDAYVDAFAAKSDSPLKVEVVSR